MPTKVKVRFAPSPTGPFSLGNARTALFNWLFARHEDGEFTLRIEDTDKERSKKEYENQILDSLKWLGLNWDGEIIRQSERIEIYEKYLKKLLDDKKAYYCFCSEEELETERQAQLAQGLPPKYGNRCRNLSAEEIKSLLLSKSAVIRFKLPENEVSFTDLIRGKISFDLSLMGDIVIAKSLKEPLYNFAVVIDDYETQITHIIRGEDHLPNTPKQWAIAEALDFHHPIYAHLPLILGADKKKLSKRYLDASMTDFKNKGYLTEAILNFLGLIGWHPKEDKEIIAIDEMIKTFDLKRVQKGGGVFNAEKLDWFNGYYIRNSDMEKLAEMIKNFVPDYWLKQKPLFAKVLAIEKERIKRLIDFKENASFFFELPNYDKNLLIWKESDFEKLKKNLEKILIILENNAMPQINGLLSQFAETEGRGDIFWPLRVALSGQKTSPGPLEIIEILGEEESIKRIKIAIGKLSDDGLGI